MSENNISNLLKKDIDPTWRSKDNDQNSRFMEAIYTALEKCSGFNKIIGFDIRDILLRYLESSGDFSEEVFASVSLIRNSEAENENEKLSLLMDIMSLKKLLIQLLGGVN